MDKKDAEYRNVEPTSKEPLTYENTHCLILIIC